MFCPAGSRVGGNPPLPPSKITDDIQYSCCFFLLTATRLTIFQGVGVGCIGGDGGGDCCCCCFRVLRGRKPASCGALLFVVANWVAVGMGIERKSEGRKKKKAARKFCQSDAIRIVTQMKQQGQWGWGPAPEVARGWCPSLAKPTKPAFLYASGQGGGGEYSRKKEKLKREACFGRGWLNGADRTINQGMLPGLANAGWGEETRIGLLSGLSVCNPTSL